MITSFSKTIKNSKTYYKPNEDYFINDDKNKIYILTDGVSRDRVNDIYPINSPSRKVSEIFSKAVFHFIAHKFNEFNNKETLLRTAMIEGNNEIAKFNRNYKGDFLPGTVGIISIVFQGFFYYAYIGDCFGIRLANNQKIVFTNIQTELIHKHIKEYTTYEIRNIICNNINHPYSYGVLNGDDRASDFIVTGKFPLQQTKTVLLFSDGFEKYLASKDAEELSLLDLDILSYKEDYFSDDDKTIIKICIEEGKNEKY